MAEEVQGNLAEVVAYQGMKIGQLGERLHQLELMFVQFSKTANANQQKFIQELSQFRVELEAVKKPLGNCATQTDIFDGEVARGAAMTGAVAQLSSPAA